MAPGAAQNAVIKRTLHLEVPIEKAFHVFTERMGLWWPASHHVGGTPFKDILIDKKQGGRWYEINGKVRSVFGERSLPMSRRRK